MTGRPIGLCKIAATASGWRRFVRLAVLCLCMLWQVPALQAAPLLAPANPVVPVTPNHQTRWQELTETVFQHYTAENGLPHSVITAIVEDKQGFLWFGTQGGLVRWDGYRFQTYLPKADDVHSLPDNFVQALHIDQQGQLWIGTLAGGLARYVVEEDHFVRIGIGEKGVSHPQVNDIADDGKGGIWVATSGGLEHLPAQSNRFEHFRHDANQPQSLVDDTVRILLFDQQARLWVGSRKGLMQMQGKQFIPVNLPTAQGNLPQIRSLYQSQDGRIWVGTTGNGAFVIDQQGRAQQIIETETAKKPLVSLTEEVINAIIEVEPGQIWLGSYGRGIIVVEGEELRTRRIQRDPSIATSLLSDAIISLWRDRSGLTWTGSVRGISRFNPIQKGILTYFGNARRHQNVPETDVAAATLMPDGKIWFGLFGKGIAVVNPHADAIEMLEISPSVAKNRIASAVITSITQPVLGYVYIGTTRGLYRYELASKQLQIIPINQLASNEAVRELLLADNTLWIATEGGLLKIELPSNPSVAPTSQIVPQLMKQSINALARAPDGAIWLGTRNNGLFRYEVNSKTLEHFTHQEKQADSLSANNISSLLFDQDGQLWVGTLGGGISFLRPKALPLRFERIGNQRGLHNLMIGIIMAGKNGQIWASTAVGLVNIDTHTLQAREMRRADGVTIPSYWVNSGVVTPYGEWLFGGIGGVTILRPDFLKKWEYVPPVVITSLRIGGKQIPSSRFNLASAQPAAPDSKAPPPAALKIGAHENSISVEFSALDFSAPEMNQYEYRLDGFDQDWISTDASRRVAAYTNLPPGQYQLLLRATNRLGIWNKQEHVLSITVLPAWHQTWWFMLAEALAAVLVVAGLIHARTKYLRQRQLELAEQVAQRTQQLHQNQAQLVATNQELQGANAALNDANSALNTANREMALSVDTLRFLGDIGRDITANLDAQVVFQSLYLYVDGLLDAPFLAIFRTLESGQGLELVFGREDDNILPAYGISLHNPVSNVARVARERKEALLHFDPHVVPPSHLPGTRAMLTALYAPLIVGEQLLGVMSIQSAHSNAYGERERLIFRTLSSYGAIALANARALAALQQAQSQLVQQEKLASLGGMVAGIAHEINTPLGTTLMAISGAAGQWQQLESALSQGSMSRSLLETSTKHGTEFTALAMSAAQRTADLITTFKSIVVHEHSEPGNAIELLPYLSDLLSMVQGPLHQRGCQVEVDVPAGLYVSAINEELTETLMRIFANVLDHAFSDERMGKMRISAHPAANKMVEIIVADDGHGIATEHLGKVFDPFFTTKSGTAGHVGLGLHVAFNHVTQGLGGTIHVASVDGEGTTVTICLPAPGKQPAANNAAMAMV